jgi:hypothetical protein
MKIEEEKWYYQKHARENTYVNKSKQLKHTWTVNHAKLTNENDSHEYSASEGT